jgi:hypothetical protein
MFKNHYILYIGDYLIKKILIEIYKYNMIIIIKKKFSIVYLPKSEKVLLCDEQQIQNFDMNKLYKTPLFE